MGILTKQTSAALNSIKGNGIYFKYAGTASKEYNWPTERSSLNRFKEFFIFISLQLCDDGNTEDQQPAQNLLSYRFSHY